MTREQAKILCSENWEILKGYASGKTVQWQKLGGDWEDFDPKKHHLWTLDNWRIKPEPKLRPWKPEEVPVGALCKRKLDQSGEISVIIGVTQQKVIFHGRPPAGSEYISDLLTYHGGHNGDMVLHSRDNGKTWHPCGVEE